MPRKRRRFAWFLAALVLGGCAHAPSGIPIASHPAAAHTTALLAYYRHIALLPPDALDREYAAAQADFSQAPDTAQRLRLALLLSLPGTRFHDPEAVLRLLDSEDAASASGTLADFAFLLAHQASAERDTEAQLRIASDRAAALQRKLDGLKSIERSMNRRQLPRATP